MSELGAGAVLAEVRQLARDATAMHGDAAALLDDRGLPTLLLPARRLLDKPFPPVSFAIEPYFPRGEITELVGAHGIFKSTVAIGACFSVATGRTWGGAPVEQGPAVFITMEDGERTLAMRAKAWLDGIPAGQERAEAEDGLRRRFLYLAREQAQGIALTLTTAGSTAQCTPTIAALSDLVAGASLVVLETASRLHDGPEMNEALSVFARAVENIATSTGAAVSIVRHVSKAAARDQTTDSYAGRGGGALSDAARSVLVMTPDRKAGEDEDADPLAPVRLTHAKATLTARGPRIVWKPVKSEHGVYLHALTEGEGLREDARRLLQHLAQVGEGVTMSDLHKHAPAGLGRAAAKAALLHLADARRVVARDEERGRNHQRVTVYRLAEAVR